MKSRGVFFEEHEAKRHGPSTYARRGDGETKRGNMKTSCSTGAAQVIARSAVTSGDGCWISGSEHLKRDHPDQRKGNGGDGEGGGKGSASGAPASGDGSTQKQSKHRLVSGSDEGQRHGGGAGAG